MGAIVSGQGSEEVVQRSTGALFFELSGCAIGHNHTAVDDDGAGAGGIDFFEDVGRKQNGLGLAEAFDQLADFVFLVGVKTVGGFIENEHGGIVKESLGKAGAVAVAFRERVDGLLGDTFEKTSLDGFLYSTFFRSSAQVADISTKIKKSGDCHIIVKWCGLGQVANLRFGEVGGIDDGVAAYTGIAGTGRDESGDHAHGCRFAGAVGTEKSKHFAWFDGE